VNSKESTAQRILLVEDNEELSSMLSVFLEGKGFDVRKAHDGVAALAHYWTSLNEDRPFDVILLDCALPRLDGFTVALNIRRAEKIGKNIPRAKIAAITAYAERVEDSHILSEIDFDAYFTKPFDVDNVNHMIGNWLNKGKAR
jgi:DNA-binding response OmpR family regulator